MASMCQGPGTTSTPTLSHVLTIGLGVQFDLGLSKVQSPQGKPQGDFFDSGDRSSTPIGELKQEAVRPRCPRLNLDSPRNIASLGIGGQTSHDHRLPGGL